MLYLHDEMLTCLAIAERWLIDPHDFVSVACTDNESAQTQFLEDCETFDALKPVVRSHLMRDAELRHALVKAGPAQPLSTPRKYFADKPSVTYTECLLDHLEELALIGHLVRSRATLEKEAKSIEECVGRFWRLDDLHFDFEFSNSLPANVRLECARADVLIGTPSRDEPTIFAAVDAHSFDTAAGSIVEAERRAKLYVAEHADEAVTMKVTKWTKYIRCGADTLDKLPTWRHCCERFGDPRFKKAKPKTQSFHDGIADENALSPADALLDRLSDDERATELCRAMAEQKREAKRDGIEYHEPADVDLD